LQRQRIATQQAADAADGLGDAAGRSTRAFVDHREAADETSQTLGDMAETFGISSEAFDLLTGKLAKAAAIGALATAFVSANREAAQLTAQFRAMTGDAVAAQEEIQFLTGVANRWGIAVNDLAPAYLRLSAATKGSTAEGEATRKMIEDLSAAYINAGAGTEDLNDAMEILGEAFSEGRISVDDLKGAIQEDMPPALQAATTAVLENDAALQKMMETGDAATEDFMPAFAAALRQHIGGSTTEVNSLAASMSRLSERVKALFVDVDNQTGAMTGFDAVLNAVVKTMETGVAAVEILTTGFGLVGTAVGAATGALMTGADAIAAVGDEADVASEKIAKSALSLWGLKTASEEAAIRQAQMQKELQALREETDPYGAALDRLQKDLQDAAAEFQRTGDVVKLTQTALEDFFKAPEKSLNVEGVLKLAAALKVVGGEAEDSGRKISDTLGQELSKLTSEQLAELERQARSAMAAASDGSETSRKAFAELGQVIEGVVLARLQRLGVDGPEALRGVSTAATEAIADFTALADSGALSADGIKAAFAGALQQLDNPEELEKFRQQIIELGKSGSLTGDQVAEALLLIKQRVQETATDPAFTALQQALADIRDETEKGIEVGNRERESLQTRLQSAIELAKAKGDEADAARLSAVATKEEVDQAELRIQQLGRQQTEIDAHIQKVYAQANADGIYTDEERKVIEALQDKTVALGQDRAELEARLPVLEKEAATAALVAGPIGELTMLYQKQSAELERNTQLMVQRIDQGLKIQQQQATEEQQALQLLELDKQGLQVGAQTLQSEIAEAEAAGDTAKANELKLELADNLIAQAEQEIKIAEQKVRVARELVEMSEAERQAALKKVEAYKKQVAEEEKLLAATLAQADAEDGRDENERKAIAAIQAKIATLQSEVIAQQGAADAAAASVEQGEKQVAISQKGVEAAKAAKDAAIANKEALQEKIAAQDDDTDSTDKNTNSTDKNTGATKNNTAASDAAARAKAAQAEATAKLEEQQRKEEAAAQAAADAQKAAAEAAQEHAQELYDLQVEALEAAEALNDLADSLDTELLKARGDDLGVAMKEFGGQLLDIEVLYEKAGVAGKEAYAGAMTDAKELHKIKLDALLKEGSITEQQYREAMNQVGAQIQEAKKQAEIEAEKEDVLKAQQDAIQAMTASTQEATAAVQEMQKQFSRLAAAVGEVTAELSGLSTLNKVAAGDMKAQWSEVNQTIISAKGSVNQLGSETSKVAEGMKGLGSANLSGVIEQSAQLTRNFSELNGLL